MKKVLYTLLFFTLSLAFLCPSLAKINVLSAYADDYSAKSVVLMDADSGQILFEKDKQKQLPVASMVKLMTILLTLENIENGNLTLETKVQASQKSASMGGSQVFLDAYSEYTIEQLLKSTIIASANDASVCLAETIAGSESEFVKMMNKRALELGMSNTNYENSTGLPMPNAYACAEDIALVTREVLKYPIYYNYSTIWMEDLVHPSGRITGLTNTNRLIRYYKGCDAGKTGSTNEAGYCVSASAKKNNLRLISVVIGAKTGAERFSQAGTLLDYGFANYENTKLLSSGQEIAQEVAISNAKMKSFKPIVSKDCYALSKKGEKNELSLEYIIDENLSAPLNVSDKVGTVYVIKNGEVINEIALEAPENIKKYTLKDSIVDIINKWKI